MGIFIAFVGMIMLVYTLFKNMTYVQTTEEPETAENITFIAVVVGIILVIIGVIIIKL